MEFVHHNFRVCFYLDAGFQHHPSVPSSSWCQIIKFIKEKTKGKGEYRVKPCQLVDQTLHKARSLE